MRKKILIVVCVLSMHISLAAQGTFKPGSEPTGFGGVQWGTHISAFSGLNLKESNPGEETVKKVYPNAAGMDRFVGSVEKSYRSDNAVLRFEGVPVDEINYVFRKERFSGVLFFARGKEVFDRLTQACFSKYGETTLDYASGNYFGGYFWRGAETEVTLLFGAGDIAILSIASSKPQNRS